MYPPPYKKGLRDFAIGFESAIRKKVLQNALGIVGLSIYCTTANAQQIGPGDLVIPNATTILQSPNQNAAIGMTPQPNWRLSLNLRGTTSAPAPSKGIDIWTNSITQGQVGGGYTQTPPADVFRVFSTPFQYGAFQPGAEVFKIDGLGNVSGGNFLGRIDNELRLGHSNNLYTLLKNGRLEWRRPQDGNLSFLELAESGHVGVNTQNPETMLHIKTENVPNDGEIGQIHGLLIENNGYRDHDHAFEIRTGHGRIFSVGNSATVHIGEGLNWEIPYHTTGRFRLYVQDGIRTEKIRVDIASANGWADYVFEEDYELMPIAELKDFIATHRHLPNVPSEAQVQAEGIDLAEMNAILLRQIEELTLRVISLQEQVEQMTKPTTNENTD
jgi:hypothetical protein